MTENGMMVYQKIDDLSTFVRGFGQAMYESRLFGCNNAQQGMVLAMAMACEGMSPIEIKRKYHLVEGELQMRSDAMLAEFRLRGGKHKILKRDSESASVELIMGDSTYVSTFTHEDAKKEPFYYNKEGQAKKNYATPRIRMQMLWARAISDGVRAMCPEVNCGVYVPEEMDTDQVVVVPPKAAAPAPTPAPKPEEPVVEAEFTPTEEAPFEMSSKPPGITAAQSKQLTAMKKDMGLSAADWKEYLKPYNVSSAKELSAAEAEAFIGVLLGEMNRRKESAELDTWAEAASS